MKGKIEPKVFGVIAVLGTMLLTIFTATPAYATPESSNSIGVEYAETIASFQVQYIPTFIANYSEWKNATVEQSETYYNLEGKKSAYAFNVIKNGQYAGYVLISATKDDYPILEFSTERLPNAIPELTTQSDKLAEKSATEKKIKCRPITKYLFGCNVLLYRIHTN